MSGARAGAWPPEATKPFWSEVLVHAFGVIVSAGTLVAVAHWPAADMPLLQFVLVSPLGIAICLNPLVRIASRGPIRKRFNLGRDPASWWFKMTGARWNVPYARQNLPSWQFSTNNLYFVGIGRELGHFMAYLATFALAAPWFEGIQTVLSLFLELLTAPAILALAIIFSVLGFFSTIFRNTLPEPQFEMRME